MRRIGYGYSAFSFVRVDVIRHKNDILLCKIIKTASPGKNTAYQFMIYLACSLLVRCTGITVLEHGYFFRYSISLGFENSFPLSVIITGNRLLNTFAPITSSNASIMRIANPDVLASIRKAKTRLVSTKWIVSKHLSPTRPITVSIWTMVVSRRSSRSF